MNVKWLMANIYSLADGFQLLDFRSVLFRVIDLSLFRDTTMEFPEHRSVQYDKFLSFLGEKLDIVKRGIKRSTIQVADRSDSDINIGENSQRAGQRERWRVGLRGSIFLRLFCFAAHPGRSQNSIRNHNGRLSAHDPSYEAVKLVFLRRALSAPPRASSSFLSLRSYQNADDSRSPYGATLLSWGII